MGKIFRLTGVPAKMSVPTPAETAEIEASLRAQGFVAWDGIERQGTAVWHVDNARAQGSRSYDLRVIGATLEILARPREA